MNDRGAEREASSRVDALRVAIQESPAAPIDRAGT